MYNLHYELENMAIAAQNAIEDNFDEQVTRFQQLFAYTYTQAKTALHQYRDSISRQLISNAHWEIVRDEREAQYYDREAYEYAMETGVFARQVLHTQPEAVGDPKAHIWSSWRAF